MKKRSYFQELIFINRQIISFDEGYGLRFLFICPCWGALLDLIGFTILFGTLDLILNTSLLISVENFILSINIFLQILLYYILGYPFHMLFEISQSKKRHNY